MNAIKTILFVATLFTATVYADPVIVPNTFTAGTPAKASEVNANFNVLANAVNAAPKPLMVYDSAGKVIGQYQNNNAIFVTGFGSPFYLNWVTSNQLGTGGAVYYTGSNCSGAAFLPHVEWLLKFGEVIGASAYIPSDSMQQVNIFSRLTANEGCIDGFVGNVPVSSIERIVDLSILTPPFSIQ